MIDQEPALTPDEELEDQPRELVEGADLDDDLPAPETGLHALGQLATAVLVVGALVLTFLAVALAAGWIFR